MKTERRDIPMVSFAQVNAMEFLFNEDNRRITVRQENKTWKQSDAYEPYIQIVVEKELVTLLLKDALQIDSKPIHTGVGKGMRTVYSGWSVRGKIIPVMIETMVWVHLSTGRLYFELVSLNETHGIQQAMWPVPWEWGVADEQAYSVFPLFQGALIPSNWADEVKGCGYWHFCEVGAPMPWFGQIDHGYGCLQIITTPWDAGYRFHHPAGGPTEFYPIWESSLGSLRYKRTVRMDFFENCDYNTLCKCYRQYIKEQGKLLTLRQKAIENPKINELVGSPIIHSHIYYYVKPEAVIYQKDKPENNYKFEPFEKRKKQLQALSARGLKKAYFHLDGWGVDGYDQQHPDILPPCEKAGGAVKMKELAETCREQQILFALHDQYRDYYLDATSYDEENAVHHADGLVPGECTWNGGDQTYLCTSLASYYVERNYNGLADLGIYPDGAYLDVFSCVKLDECHHKEHIMSRKECVEYRAGCMELLRARGMIISSETAVDTMIPHMELCHYAPYMGEPAQTDTGISVPLLNLVYHDCVIIPWIIRNDDTQKVDPLRFLQPLLNGDPAYLDIEADDEEMEKAAEISALHEKVAFSEMVRHEFLNSGRTIERTTFDNGITVTVNFDEQSYQIDFCSAFEPINE